MAFTYYTPFVVAAAQVPSAQTNFPALILVTDNRFRTIANGGNVADANGYDIRPYASDGVTARTYELVPGTYVATTGAFEMWVLVPSIDVGTEIRLYYGDAALSSDGSSTSTWNSNFKAVYHLGTASTISLVDSTSNANTLTNTNTTPATAGQMSGAAAFNGATNSRRLSKTAPVSTVTTNFTMLAWVKPNAVTQFGMIVSNGNDDSLNGFGFEHSVSGGSGTHFVALIQGVARKDSGYAFPDTTSWHRIVCANDAGTWRPYVDGVAQTTSATSTEATPTSAFAIGSLNPASRYYDGSVDEVQVIDAVVGANWITTDFNNQSAPTTFWPTGTETAVGGGTAAATLGRLPLTGVQ